MFSCVRVVFMWGLECVVSKLFRNCEDARYHPRRWLCTLLCFVWHCVYACMCILLFQDRERQKGRAPCQAQERRTVHPARVGAVRQGRRGVLPGHGQAQVLQHQQPLGQVSRARREFPPSRGVVTVPPHPGMIRTHPWIVNPSVHLHLRSHREPSPNGATLGARTLAHRWCFIPVVFDYFICLACTRVHAFFFFHLFSCFFFL